MEKRELKVLKTLMKARDNRLDDLGIAKSAKVSPIFVDELIESLQEKGLVKRVTGEKGKEEYALTMKGELEVTGGGNRETVDLGFDERDGNAQKAVEVEEIEPIFAARSGLPGDWMEWVKYGAVGFAAAFMCFLLMFFIVVKPYVNRRVRIGSDSAVTEFRLQKAMKSAASVREVGSLKKQIYSLNRKVDYLTKKLNSASNKSTTAKRKHRR